MALVIKSPPLFKDDDDYDQWKKDVELWTVITDLPPVKYAIAIHLTLSGRARQASNELSVLELKSSDGYKLLMEKLDRVFLQDINWKCFNSYLAFENYRRGPETPIDEYLSEFDRRYHKLKECDVTLPDAIIACRLLKSCSLSDVHFQLALSTTMKMTFDDMRSTLKKLFTDIGARAITNSGECSSVATIKSEPNDAFYGRSSRRGRGNFEPRSNRGSFRGKNGRQSNPVDYRGDVSKCFECGSEQHWARNCPRKNGSGDYRYDRSSSDNYFTETEISLIAYEVFETKVRDFSAETIGHIVLDSGCSRTVCGVEWFDTYIDTLNDRERRGIEYENTNSVFRFGDGQLLNSIKCVILPCEFAGKFVTIRTEIVNSNIPLLLSKQSMKKAGMKLNLVNDTAVVFGNEIKLTNTASGHYSVPIYRTPTRERVHAVMYSCDKKDHRMLATKLHKQFAHPTSDKLKKLLRDAGKCDKDLLRAVEDISQSCETCLKYKRPHSRPVVAMPLATSFNETVSADLKKWNNVYFLVLVDVATRYCNAVVINNKQPSTIIKSFFTHWICYFGAPKQFLTDNGGEFSNDEMRSLADNFGIKLLNTAAESPWSNGICERLNGILSMSVQRVIDDASCSVEIALSWAVSARNCLHNFSGYSPSQLVYGRNPSFPNVVDANPSQLENITSSEIVANNLNALNAARRDFIRNESNEKIQRALLRQVRDDDPRKFTVGDSVFYKRNISDKWRGPARVIGRDGKQVIVRHGGMVIRVHACRMQHGNLSEKDDVRSKNDDSDHVIDEPVKCPSVSEDDNDFVEQPNPCSVEGTTNSSVQESSEAVPEITNSQINANRMKVGSRIEFLDSHGTRQSGQIHSRAGKASGKYGSHYNLKYPSGDIHCVDVGSVDGLRVVPDESEVFVSVSSDAVYDAKIKEIESWKENEVYVEEIEDGQTLLSVRWVVTEKVKNDKTVTKARLVVRGFEEMFQDRTDSPTCSKDSLRLSLWIMSHMKWKCQSIDVRSAFLQGQEIERNVFVRPPPEFDEGRVWRLQKSVYGLNDAARAWYQTLKMKLLDLNVDMNSLDQAFFHFTSKSVLHGVMCIHVDDILFAGTTVFMHSVMNPLMNSLKIGSTDERSFKYIGVNIEQKEKLIMINQTDYVSSLEPVFISKERLQRRFDELGVRELESYRAIVGQLNWLSTQTRPDIAFSVSQLSKRCKGAKVDDLVRANKVVKLVKAIEICISYRALDNFGDAIIECYCDASYGNLDDGGSQGGYLIFLSDGQGNRNLISWQSRRVKRVVKSTLAAEALALVDAAQAGVFLAHLVSEVMYSSGNLQPVKCYVDNRSLVESLYSTKSVEDKHLRIEISVLRDMINTGQIAEVSWVQTSKQLANALTKAGASTSSLTAVMQ